MQPIEDWLAKIGLERYAAAFANNDIDVAVLPHLTDADLEKVGVSLGHRRKMLAAIAELRGAIPASPQPHDRAERRQVTVMFSDLVGSTALSARMDPEDLREVISAYQKCVAASVRRFGGFVARYLGDGVLVYFGYPQAHEDDADRAVRAGLELIAAVAGLKTHAVLQTRVGLATGVVVVGDIEESGEGRERGIVGETPNLAARLQAIADPDMVVIAPGTRRLLGNLFELDDLGARNLKGMPGSVRAWAVLRASSVESRFEALRGSGLTDLVGREEETELLLQRWSRAKTGEGQVALLSGEAGIGKSRLTVALLDHLAAEPHTPLRYFCSAQHTDSALYPIIRQMQRAARLAHNDAPRARLDKLDALLAQTSASIEDATLFAEMLSLPNDGRYPTLDLDPQQRRQRTLQALVLRLEVLARSSPVLMIFEDAHWTDPTSLELLGRVVDRIRNFPVLLIVTFRPEFDPPWIERPYVTALTINRLAEHEVSAMIDRLVGNRFMSTSIRQDIVERTDGIPLFIEEMTKAVVEAESGHTAERAISAAPSPALAVPASLHASLMARLDRLGPAKEVAQIGAVIGREFSHALLAPVVRKSEAELSSALDRLIAAGLLFQQGVPPHATYLFKHALVQDAAYSTLLREPRRALHARIAKTLESQFADVAESEPELLAHHCTEAGLIEKAVHYSRRAGLKAAARWALQDARHWFDQALTMLVKLPESRVTLEQGFEIRLELRPVLSQAADVRQVLRLLVEAEALAERLDDRARIARVSTFTISIYGIIGELDKALAIGTRAVSIARDTGDTELRILNTMHLEMVHFLRGEFMRVVELARENLAASAVLPVSNNMGASAPPSAFDRFYLAQSLAQLGRFSEAAEVNAEAMRAATLGTQIITVGIACYGAASPAILKGDWAEAQAILERWIPVARSGDLAIQLVAATAHAAFVSVYVGNTHEAFERYALGKELIERMLAKGPNALHGFFDFLLGCAALRLGKLGEARQLCERSAQRKDSAGYAMCLHGDIASHPDGFDPVRAESCFRRALSLAELHGMRPLQSLSQLGLGRLYRRAGRLEEARTTLSQSMKMLRAMEMTFWLSEAEGELQQIG